MDLIDSIIMKYKNIGKKELAFFEKYINTYSPTGYETEGQKVWLDFVKDYIDTYEVDDYGTVVGIVNPEEKFKVVIEAHADEISWVVHHITDNGFIYVKRNGGMDPIIAPSMRVVLHTKKGLVPAVFGWPAIHTRGAGAKQEYP
ncbi:MAG: M42 family peptidase, partial [Bacteroidota bacterium]|nr:M42 family peptidase [Bacteroidota bacterium]